MLQWACDAAEGSKKHLLELYCGNGNFTLPLSLKFERVLATELAKSSVYAAQWNIEQNQIDNIQVARLSAEEFTKPIKVNVNSAVYKKQILIFKATTSIRYSLILHAQELTMKL